MRRSTSRTLSRYRSRRFRSSVPTLALSVATSSTIQSRMLWLVRLRTARSSLLPPAPKRRSNAARGSRIIGSGSVGDAQLIASVYAQ